MKLTISLSDEEVAEALAEWLAQKFSLPVGVTWFGDASLVEDSDRGKWLADFEVEI